MLCLGQVWAGHRFFCESSQHLDLDGEGGCGSVTAFLPPCSLPPSLPLAASLLPSLFLCVPVLCCFVSADFCPSVILLLPLSLSLTPFCPPLLPSFSLSLWVSLCVSLPEYLYVSPFVSLHLLSLCLCTAPPPSMLSFSPSSLLSCLWEEGRDHWAGLDVIKRKKGERTPFLLLAPGECLTMRDTLVGNR